jgi:predicted ester cyclase
MTQQEQNRALVLDLFKSMDARDFDRCLQLVSPDCRVHFGGTVLDRAAWAAMGKMFMDAFPDGRHVWDLAEAAGDYVLLNGTFTGTQTGEFQGLPPSGKAVRISLTMIDKVRDGRMIEHRADFDSAGLMQQLSQ